MIYPPRLLNNDTVGIISPASSIDKKVLDKGVVFLKSLGLNIKFGNYLFEENNYLAGTDEQRLADFHCLIEDADVKAIIFARGGYGTARFVANIDYNLIKENPKIIWGFSDITYLHTAIRQNTGLITFHGPMVMSAGRMEFDQISASGFQQLFLPTICKYDESISPLEVMIEGEAEGQLVGGNLTLITSSIGTPYEIDLKGKILLIEDVDEKLYMIDAKLNQLKLSNKLKDIAGIAIGDFSDVKTDTTDEASIQKYLFELFYNYFKDLNIPIMSGFKIGHCYPHYSIPLGTNAKLSTKTKTLIIEPGVK